MNNKFRTPVRLLLIVAAFILLFYPSASMAWTEALYPGMLDRAGAIKATAQVTRIGYPNADTVDVDVHKWVKYREDGTYIEWFECYSKILTEKGRSSLTTLSSSFTIPYNDTAFKIVEIISSDGTVQTVDASGNSRIMIEPSQMKSNIYNPNSKILRLNVPDLNIGDTIHYIIRDNFTKVRTPGTWSDYVTFEGTSPIKRSLFTVIAPKGTPLQRMALKSEIPGTVTFKKSEENGSIVYKWMAKNVPQTIPEPDMPPLYTQVQRLLVSTNRDWESLSRWYWNLCKPNMGKITPPMRAVVAKLIQGKDDPEERMQAIFTWVSQKIRYLGLTVEKDSPGYEPHPVSMTFDQRAGVCRDKAALLAAMLRIAGLEAYPTLIMNGPKKDSEVPQLFFNHAITAVREPGGSYRLMDATDENTSRMFPSYLGNQSYLVATPKGETLRTSPVESADENMMVIAIQGTLDVNGRLTAQSTLHFNGINDNAYRGAFARMLPDEQQGFFEKMIKEFVPGARLISYTVLPENMMNTAQPLIVKLAFESGDIRIVGKDTIMLPLPEMGGHLGMVNHLLGRTGLEKRKYPLFTEYTCGVRETMDLKLSRAVGKLKDLPQYAVVENEGVSWSRKLTMADNTLHSENLFKLKLPQYSPEQYLSLRELLRKKEVCNQRMVLFNPLEIEAYPIAEKWYSAFQADAVVLNEEIEYKVKDTRNWTCIRNVTIKVLTYAGKKKYSDIRMDFNPVWEEVYLEKARVTGPSGKVKTITEQEINTMDAGWVGEAPRYPGEKTMVASLPGVEVGSVIELTVVRRKKNQSFFSLGGDFLSQDPAAWDHEKGGHNRFFSANPVFRYTDPILKKTIRLEIPSKLPIKILRADQGLGLNKIWERSSSRVITEKSRKEGGCTIHEFTARHIAPVKSEKNLPPWYTFNPTLFVSAGSWESYAEIVGKALEKGARVESEIITKARELIRDATDNRSRIKAIRDFVARQITFVDIGFSRLPLDQITPALRTLTDGYGNSADRAVLIHALLQAAGFNSEYVLVSKSSRVADLARAMEEYPAPQWLDTVLVRVQDAGEFIYLNDTDQYAELGSTPSTGLPGMMVSSGRFEIIHAPIANLNDAQDSSYRIQLADNGDAVIQKKILYYGNEFAEFHKLFSQMPPEKRRRYFQEQVTALSRGAKLLGKYLVDYDTYPGKEEFSVRVKEYAIRQDDFLYLKLSGLIGNMAGVGRDQRQNPMYRNYFHKGSVDIEVVLPDKAVSMEKIPPGKLQFNIPRAGTISMETRSIPDGQSLPSRLRITQKVNMEPMVVLPDEYLQLLEMCRILSQPKTGMVLIKMEQN
ncbi:MAG: hypothetical protein AVO34_06165 [Firmicutes bacterium ML8_F2]|nr:MAG: hypothetical protein AVO34_06165 [Firmicutes bacterium ML8_F2]